MLHYHESHLIAARQRQKTEEFQVVYHIRAKVERKIAEMVNHGMRQARYIGWVKKELQALWTGAAVNLKRLFKLIQGDFCRLRGALDSLFARKSRPMRLPAVSLLTRSGQTMPFLGELD